MSAVPADGFVRVSAEDTLVRTLRTVLGGVVLALLLITFTPFQATSSANDAGNLVNQIGYGALGVLAVLGHLLFTERLVARALLRPTWLLILLTLLYSVTRSLDPAQTLRTVAFVAMAMAAGTAVVTLPPDARAFRASLTIGALAVLGLCYFGVIFWPGIAVHQASGDEAQHAGLWRGLYPHKNLAAPIMAGLLFVGIYLLRSGGGVLAWIVTLLVALFVLKTGSKTSNALVPLVAVLVVGGRALGGRRLPVAVMLVSVFVMALLTIGSVLSPFLDGILQSILPGTTFTGRADLWRFALDTMAPHAWAGYGLESFWLTDNVFRAETPFELSWDPRGIVNAHNGYLDMAIALGWPGLMVVVLGLVLAPAADYLRCRPGIETERLGDLFLMILTFALLNSFLESYFFHRADPVWMLTWIAVVGLRLVGRFEIRP